MARWHSRPYYRSQTFCQICQFFPFSRYLCFLFWVNDADGLCYPRSSHKGWKQGTQDIHTSHPLYSSLHSPCTQSLNGLLPWGQTVGPNSSSGVDMLRVPWNVSRQVLPLYQRGRHPFPTTFSSSSPAFWAPLLPSCSSRSSSDFPTPLTPRKAASMAQMIGWPSFPLH